jgi:hypothetical protein
MDNNKFQNKENEEARSNGLSVVVVGIFFFSVSDDLMSKDNNFVHNYSSFAYNITSVQIWDCRHVIL